jgi:hypothetical protein
MLRTPERCTSGNSWRGLKIHGGERRRCNFEQLFKGSTECVRDEIPCRYDGTLPTSGTGLPQAASEKEREYPPIQALKIS